MQNGKINAIVLAAAVAVAGSGAFGAARVFTQATAGSYDWNTAGNWSATLPGTADTADFKDSGLSGVGAYTVTLAADPATSIQGIRLGTGADANALTKNLTITGQKITLTGVAGTPPTNGIVYNASNTAAVTIDSGIVINGSINFNINAPASGNSKVTINGVISEAGGARAFNKTQDGVLRITNTANSFSGPVLIQNGTLEVPSFDVLGTNTGPINLGNSTNTGSIVGRLTYYGTTDATLNRNLIVNSDTAGGGTGGGRIEIPSDTVTVTFGAGSTVTGNGRFVIGGDGNFIADGAINNSLYLLKSGPGRTDLKNSANSFNGIQQQNGILRAISAAALGQPTGVINIIANASATDASPQLLTLGGFTVPQAINVNDTVGSTGTTTLGSDPSQTASAGFSGNVTLLRGVRLTSDTGAGEAVTFSGKITDGAASFGVTKVGAGTVILSSALNDYDGLTSVSAGTLKVDAAGKLGNGAVAVESGAVLELANANAIADTADLTIVAGGLVNLNFAEVIETVGSLNLGGTVYTTGTFNAALYPSFFSGGGSLVVVAVPEPASVAVFGLIAAAGLRRRKA